MTYVVCQESGLGPNMQTQATQFNAIYYLVVWGQDQSQSKKQTTKKKNWQTKPRGSRQIQKIENKVKNSTYRKTTLLHYR